METNLQAQIENARGEIRTDGYTQSIGEWISLYENNEIRISPAFQRFFRWTIEQKSKLIESILLGIPIPQIFVSQREDGVWDVVDGLQRLSTIYEFFGILKGKNGELLPPLQLSGTKYLPALEGKFWDMEGDPGNSLNQTQRLMLKRSKIGVSIILRESDEKSKFELFQRLNTGGTSLSDQEVRNAIMVMLDEDFFKKVRELADYEAFKDCVSLTDRALDEQYDMDLVTRYLILKNLAEPRLYEIGDLNDFLTDELINVIEQNQLDLENESKVFKQTFDILRDELGSDSMKKYNSSKNQFVGGFGISAFETIAIGLASNSERFDTLRGSIREIVIGVWENHVISSSGGVRASTRIPQTITAGRLIFSDNE